MPISLGIGTAVTRGGGLYGPSPQLDLNFASLLSLTPSVGPTPSYTRASTGTYFDASGVLTTAAINGPRFDHVYNGVSWVSKGLLVEEARTNDSLYSEDISNAYWNSVSGQTITSDQAVAPDGASTADRLQIAGTGFFGRQNNYLVGTYTYSVWLKSDSPTQAFMRFTDNAGTYTVAQLVNVTTTWERFSLTQTFGSGPFTYLFWGFDQRSIVGGPGTACDVYAWGFQLEAGSFPTSYIPTTTAVVTRSADVCQITGGDFSGFYNQTEGSFAVEYDRVGVDNSKDSEAILVTNSSGTHQYYLDAFGGNEVANFYISPTMQAGLALGSVSASGIYVRAAIAYKINDFVASINGAAVVTDTSGTVPTVDRMGIGRDISVGNYTLNGHIARLRYFNTRLLNSQLVALST